MSSRPPFDPESLPVTHRDTALPAVDAQRLLPQALRARFATPPTWSPELFRDVVSADAPPLRPAAVLIALLPRPDGLQLLLTQRRDDLPTHAGQISFPGGGRDARDADALHTALREAEEEIGLAPALVEPLGTMPDYTTITGYAVTPVVALVAPEARLRADPREVAEIFEVPLAFLMDPSHHELRSWDPGTGRPGTAAGPRRSFYAMPWTSPQGRTRFIWGATAAMIRNVYRLLIA